MYEINSGSRKRKSTQETGETARGLESSLSRFSSRILKNGKQTLRMCKKYIQLFLKCLWNALEIPFGGMFLKCLWNTYEISLKCLWNAFVWNVAEVAWKYLWVTCFWNTFNVSLQPAAVAVARIWINTQFLVDRASNSCPIGIYCCICMHMANQQQMSGSESPPPYFKSHMAYNYECERLSTRIPSCKLGKCGKYIQYYYV